MSPVFVQDMLIALYAAQAMHMNVNLLKCVHAAGIISSSPDSHTSFSNQHIPSIGTSYREN